MSSSNFNIRLDDSIKAEASQIFAGYGLSTSQAIKLFLNQVVATRKVPLSFDFQAVEYKPTAKVLDAIKELERDDLPTYKSVDELLGALDERI